jgi:hypothetical protein
MVQINGKSFQLFLPASVDVFIRGKAFERFESFREVIGHQEGLQMLFQVVMGLVVIRFHGGVSRRVVHAFDLAIGPGMVGFGESMVDAVLPTDAITDMLKGIAIALTADELDAVIGQHSMDLIGHSGNQVP